MNAETLPIDNASPQSLSSGEDAFRATTTTAEEPETSGRGGLSPTRRVNPLRDESLPGRCTIQYSPEDYANLDTIRTFYAMRLGTPATQSVVFRRALRLLVAHITKLQRSEPAGQDKGPEASRKRPLSLAELTEQRLVCEARRLNGGR